MNLNEWKEAIEEAKKKVAEALEGLDNEQCRFILNTFQFYGWRQSNGEWHESVHGRR